MTKDNLATHNLCIEEIEKIALNSDVRKFKVKYQDGSRGTLRIFVYSKKYVAYYRGNATARGYDLWNYAMNEKKSFASVEPVQPKTAVQKYCDNMRKFKNAFLNRSNPKLWSNIQDAYSQIDIDTIQSQMEESDKLNNSYDCYCWLSENYPGSGIVKENDYKTTTILANKPSPWKNNSHLHGEYQTCVENISKHIENKEDFDYTWRANYDIHVSGKNCGDGVYRAWLSREYYNCGNGYYYLLINDNSAVFCEKD